MTDYDLLKTCLSGLRLLDVRKRQFVESVSKVQRMRKSTSYFLSDRQHQYLQSCYDLVVSKKYGVEPMATDSERAAGDAISRARRALGK